MFKLCDENTLTPLVNEVASYIKTFKKYRTKAKQTFVYNIPVAFDTETTNYTTDDGQKIGWMYVWMFRFGDPLSNGSLAIYGRTTAILDEFLTKLSENLGLKCDPDNDLLLYIFVHNLGFDFEFIRDKLTIVSQLHAEPHNPIYVRDSRGFEFRDSKILTGGLSLKKVGDNLNNGLVKRVGDLDYNLIRTSNTPLDDTELGYCIGDIDVLSSYVQTQIEQYGGVQHIPLTNTGRVRKYARDYIYKSGSFGQFCRYRELMDSCTLTYEEYTQCQRAFFGGFTHANAKYVGKTLHDVVSYDFTSSYPAVMLSERFPMGKPQHVDRMTFEELRNVINDPNKSCIFDLQLSNVFVKDDVGDCYLSGDVAKVRLVNPVLDNGRVRSCDKFAITCTNIDFKIINQAYDWDNIDISNILIWENQYLPSPMLGVILDLYNAKTTLKGVAGCEEEYNIKKGMLNSLYGMCVTRILRDRIEVDGDSWITISLDDDEKRDNIDKNNKSKTRFLYYPWGVFITSYARFNLWTAIKTLGEDYIYSDTDSIKVFADSKKLQTYLNDYQHDLDLKFSWMLAKRRKFTFDDLSPRTKDGVPKPIGVWDYEGKYTMFKTLGAKRYIKLDEKGLFPTVAGISPKNLSKYLVKTNSRINDDETVTIDYDGALDDFKDGLHVPPENTGKLASIYYQDVDMIVTDYTGISCHVTQKYGVHLTPVDFTLTMSGSFIDLIKQLQNLI